MERDTFCNTWWGIFSLRRWTMSKVLETSKGYKAFTIYPGCPTVPIVTMGLFLRRMKEVKVIFYEVLSQFPKKHSVLEGSHALLFCPSDTINIWIKKGMVHRWSGSGRRKQKIQRKSCSYANLSTTNPTRNGSNWGLRSERPETRRLSCTKVV